MVLPSVCECVRLAIQKVNRSLLFCIGKCIYPITFLVV